MAVRKRPAGMASISQCEPRYERRGEPPGEPRDEPRCEPDSASPFALPTIKAVPRDGRDDEPRDRRADGVADLEKAARSRALPGVVGAEALQDRGLFDADAHRVSHLRGQALSWPPGRIAISGVGRGDSRIAEHSGRRPLPRPLRPALSHRPRRSSPNRARSSTSPRPSRWSGPGSWRGGSAPSGGCRSRSGCWCG